MLASSASNARRPMTRSEVELLVLCTEAQTEHPLHREISSQPTDFGSAAQVCFSCEVVEWHAPCCTSCKAVLPKVYRVSLEEESGQALEQPQSCLSTGSNPLLFPWAWGVRRRLSGPHPALHWPVGQHRLRQRQINRGTSNSGVLLGLRFFLSKEFQQ